MTELERQIVVVSNRLPIVLEHDDDGQLRARRGSGGLVSALQPVLAANDGRWIGWLGIPESTDAGPELDAGPLLRRLERELGHRLDVVPLTTVEIENYYQGFANEVLWPLFHDHPDRCRFEPSYWHSYEAVNRKFAEIVAERTTATELVWVHDYHLIRVAAALRAAGVDRRLAFFLHIPFPPLDLFAILPWRTALLEGLLAYSLVGFQTRRDLDNFVGCVTALCPGVRIEGNGVRRQLRTPSGATVTLAAAPISIDYQGFVSRAASPEVAEAVASIRAQTPENRLILGLDRLDYSKGIPQRLAAYDRMLELHPELCGQVTLLQVVVPSRVEIPEYRELEHEIQRLIGAINGKHWQLGWTPVQYAFRSLAEVEMLGYYRASDVALVTALKDGMNLVSKEYCACRLDDDGVLILSEFAGAAAELGEHCLLVNPHDVEGTAAAIHAALTMPAAEAHERMRALRRSIRHDDIFDWVEGFLGSLPRARTSARARRIIRMRSGEGREAVAGP